MRPRLPAAALEASLYAAAVAGPLACGAVEPWSRAMVETLAFSAALACFLRGRGAASTIGAAAWVLPAAFAVIGCAQCLVPAYPDGPRPWGFLTAAPDQTERVIVLWSAYAALLYAAPRVINSPEAARRCLRAVFGLGLAVAALGIAQALTSRDLVYWLRPTLKDVPPFGPYYNRDHAANLMLMSLGAGAGLLFARLRRWRVGSLRPAAATAGGLVFLLGAVAFSGSRGAWLALPLGVSALAAAVAAASGRRVALVGSLGSLALVVFFAFAHVQGGEAAGAPIESSARVRLQIYHDAARWLRDAPLFGTGLGSFSAVYPSYQDQSLRGAVRHAHSDWLELLLESGLSGAAVALAGAGIAAWSWLGLRRRARSREMKALIFGALLAVVVAAAHSLFEFAFQIPGNAAVLALLAGFLFSAPAWADKEARQPPSRPPGRAVGAAAVACFALFVRAALAPAFGWEPSPMRSRTLAQAALRLSELGPRDEVLVLRAALAWALEAAARRPYDGQSLFLVGASLGRLGRPADARDYFEAYERVSFAPTGPARPSQALDDRGKLEFLRRQGLLPREIPVR